MRKRWSIVKAHGNVIGIFKNDKLIVLKETDLLGIKLPDDQILLSEIVRVHPLRTQFDDPFHEQQRKMKRDHSVQ